MASLFSVPAAHDPSSKAPASRSRSPSGAARILPLCSKSRLGFTMTICEPHTGFRSATGWKPLRTRANSGVIMTGCPALPVQIMTIAVGLCKSDWSLAQVDWRRTPPPCSPLQQSFVNHDAKRGKARETRGTCWFSPPNAGAEGAPDPGVPDEPLVEQPPRVAIIRYAG